MSKSPKVELGDLVKEEVSSFQGVCAGYTTHLSNVDRVTITPQHIKGKVQGASKGFDITRVKVIQKAKVKPVPTQPVENPPGLGDEVENKITGQRGVVIAVTCWLEGCRFVECQPRGLDKDGNPFDAFACDERLARVVKRATLKPDQRTGGPRDTGIRPHSR